MIQFFKKHTLISIYLFVFAGLLYGVYKTTGAKYFPEIGIYFLSLMIFYSLFSLKKVSSFFSHKLSLKNVKLNFNINFLVFGCLGFVIFHLIYLGGSPTIQATKLTYIEDVANFRHDITYNRPRIILYISSILLNSALPFLILYLLYTKKQLLYWIVLILAVFYASSLLQKSYIVGLLIPSIIYCIVSKKYLYAMKYFAIMVGVVFLLTYIANPPAGSNPNKVLPNLTHQNDANSKQLVDENTTEHRSKLESVTRGLIDRLFVVPGRVVSDWFETIPAKKPFLYGDGYGALAKIRGREYHNYPLELYAIISPEFYARGLAGSVNVASFMYEYSNFGIAGLILSGFMLALLFSIVEIFFADKFKIKLSLNLYPILLLSSGAISTLLFSGGWGFSILFYFIFLKNKPDEQCAA